METSLGPGKRVYWKGVGSLCHGNLKGTDVWTACTIGKESWRQNTFWEILDFAFPSAPPSLLFPAFFELLPGYFQLLELMNHGWWFFPKCSSFFLN